MEGESSATSGTWLNYRLTATPSAAGTNPPTTCPITARLLELYQKCVENGVWAHVLYEARDGIEKAHFSPHNDAPFFTPSWMTQARECDKRCREARAEKRRIRSQARYLPSGGVGEEATADDSCSSFDHYGVWHRCCSGSSHECLPPLPARHLHLQIFRGNV
jgi:hypothetical protein